CLIGDGSPTRLGIGDAAGAFAGARRCSSEYGVTLYAILVSVCNPERSGAGRTDSVPVIIAAMYCDEAPGMARCASTNRGFAADDRPLPLSMKICRPSRENIDAVG